LNISSNSAGSISEIASRFVAARRQSRSIKEYPGTLPGNLDDAYRIQDQAIKLWPDEIGGWKVGLIGGQFRVQHGTDRLVGPIFNAAIRHNVSRAVNPVAVFDGGFGAVEAEFVFRIGVDTPVKKFEWTSAEAAEVVEGLYAGVEIASSPLAVINELGPTSIVSDFGNNNGLIVGARIDDWQRRLGTSLTCSTMINGVRIGIGEPTSIPGGPVASLIFALCMCASRGFPLKAGQYVCTGAVTGVHQITKRQHATICFDNIDTLECEAIASGGAAN